MISVPTFRIPATIFVDTAKGRVKSVFIGLPIALRLAARLTTDISRWSPIGSIGGACQTIIGISIWARFIAVSVICFRRSWRCAGQIAHPI